MKTLIAAVLLIGLAACNPPTAPSKAPPVPAPSPAAAPVKSAGINYVTPESWVAETPAGAMRKAQAKVPDRNKQHGDAQFTLYSMSTMLDSNIERWKGQFGGADAGVGAVEGATLKTTLIDIAGDYMPGDQMSDPIKGARMLMALAEIPGTGNSWFFKLVGPAETVAGWKIPFIDMVKAASLR